MSIAVDILGNPGWNPPPGTQLSDFVDNFDRPDAGTLGQKWGMVWGIADMTVGAQFPGPFPQRCAANPRIEDGKVVWSNLSNVTFAGQTFDIGRGWSQAWPHQLGWMTQGKFNQYAEIDVDYSLPWQSGCVLASVFSPNPGSMDPDSLNSPLPFLGAYGFYSLYINAQPQQVGDPGPISAELNYSAWGAMPASIPDGVRGHAGINTISPEHLESTGNIVSTLPARFRLETRWQNNRWEFMAYGNDQLLQTGWDTRLLSGCPSLGCNLYYENTWPGPVDPDNLLIVHNYKAGWLR